MVASLLGKKLFEHETFKIIMDNVERCNEKFSLSQFISKAITTLENVRFKNKF